MTVGIRSTNGLNKNNKIPSKINVLILRLDSFDKMRVYAILGLSRIIYHKHLHLFK